MSAAAEVVIKPKRKRGADQDRRTFGAAYIRIYMRPAFGTRTELDLDHFLWTVLRDPTMCEQVRQGRSPVAGFRLLGTDHLDLYTVRQCLRERSRQLREGVGGAEPPAGVVYIYNYEYRAGYNMEQLLGGG